MAMRDNPLCARCSGEFGRSSMRNMKERNCLLCGELFYVDCGVTARDFHYWYAYGVLLPHHGQTMRVGQFRQVRRERLAREKAAREAQREQRRKERLTARLFRDTRTGKDTATRKAKGTTP